MQKTYSNFGLSAQLRIHVGLNKSEAGNSLARAVFFNRLGDLRDRIYENQQAPC